MKDDYMCRRGRLGQAALAMIVAAGLVWTSGCDKRAQEGRAAAESSTSRGVEAAATDGSRSVVGVDAFMRSPNLQQQTVTVVGVVSAWDAKRNMLALIDRKEAAECGTVTCATLTLPVRWEGEPPRIGQQVRVTGSVRQSPEGKVFIARDLSPGEQVVDQ